MDSPRETALITPERFYGQRPPKRVFGVECEYLIQNGMDKNGIEISNGKYISNKAIQKAGYKNIGRFLDNGGDVHEDVSQLECTTPECHDPVTAAAADIATTYVIDDIVTASGYPHRGVFRITGSYIDKSKLPAETNTSRGYHENYLLPRAVTESETFAPFVAGHLASRLYAMSGTIRGNHYIWSQKIGGIGGSQPILYHLGNRTSHGSKPMAIVPRADEDNDVIGDPTWARLEVRYADAGLSPTGRYLAFAATSLVLRLIEHLPKIDSTDQDWLLLKNPVGAAQRFAHDISLTSTDLTTDGQTITALDLQNIYLDMAQTLGQEIELPPAEHQAIGLWEQVLDGLQASNPTECEYGNLPTLLDAPARHVYLANRFGPEGVVGSNREAMLHNLMWDRVSPRGIGQLWWAQHPSKYVPAGLIEQLRHQPPESRARVRAQAIQQSQLIHASFSTLTYTDGILRFIDPLNYDKYYWPPR